MIEHGSKRKKVLRHFAFSIIAFLIAVGVFIVGHMTFTSQETPDTKVEAKDRNIQDIPNDITLDPNENLPKDSPMYIFANDKKEYFRNLRGNYPGLDFEVVRLEPGNPQIIIRVNPNARFHYFFGLVDEMCGPSFAMGKEDVCLNYPDLPGNTSYFTEVNIGAHSFWLDFYEIPCLSGNSNLIKADSLYANACEVIKAKFLWYNPEANERYHYREAQAGETFDDYLGKVKNGVVHAEINIDLCEGLVNLQVIRDVNLTDLDFESFSKVLVKLSELWRDSAVSKGESLEVQIEVEEAVPMECIMNLMQLMKNRGIRKFSMQYVMHDDE